LNRISSMSEKIIGAVQIEYKGLSPEDIDSLHDFLKAKKEVTHVHSRMRSMDAVYDPSVHPTLAVIVGFAIGIANAVGRKALDIAADLVKEWLKNRQTENARAEVTLIWGPDEQPLVKVKKQDLK
jgi:hypothetical protein